MDLVRLQQTQIQQTDDPKARHPLFNNLISRNNLETTNFQQSDFIPVAAAELKTAAMLWTAAVADPFHRTADDDSQRRDEELVDATGSTEEAKM
ncbi:hypothetical protein L2E82_48258 [Cichorium intybus]|uniref:Uncharacterized protein n=1 Tax=Cichorium intybus TaxID=13427 RepID=A0ACB8YZ84_CICIN|nr:hypothetical protein L2E82_48258 [Cichorium intybus]